MLFGVKDANIKLFLNGSFFRCRSFLNGSLLNSFLSRSFFSVLSLGKKCTDRKTYTALFKVDVSDLALNLLADLENIGRLADTLICDLRNVDKSVNSGDNRCKCTEGCETYDLGINNRINGIVTAKDLPGVVLCLLVAERNLLVLLVKALDINLDLLTYGKNL